MTVGPAPPVTSACTLVGTNLVQFAVLAGSAVTNTGLTVVTLGATPPASAIDDVGTSPGTSMFGFPPGIINAPGTAQPGTALAGSAQTDATTLYNALAASPCTVDLTGMDLAD